MLPHVVLHIGLLGEAPPARGAHVRLVDPMDEFVPLQIHSESERLWTSPTLESCRRVGVFEEMFWER